MASSGFVGAMVPATAWYWFSRPRCHPDPAHATSEPGFGAPCTGAGERRVRMVALRALVPAGKEIG